MTFGKRFKELRLEKGLLQQELADDFNKIYGYIFSKSSISQYENDKRTPEIEALKDFASYFSVSIDYLLGIDENKSTSIDIINKRSHEKILNYIEEFFIDKNINFNYGGYIIAKQYR